MDCGGSFMKYMLFFFNFIFFVAGAVILGVGIWVKVDPTVTDYIGLAVNENSGTFEAAVILLICVGAFILLVGFLGCCGACQESSCMLCLFAGLMTLIVLLQVVAAILAIVFQNELGEEVKTTLADQAYYDVGIDNTLAITKSFNGMQIEFKCCGGNGPTDYGEHSRIWNETEDATGGNKNVPQSCCSVLTDDSTPDDPEAPNYEECSLAAAAGTGDAVWQKGCYDGLVDWIKKHAVIVIGIGFGLAVVEILGIIFACCVRNKISE